MPLRCCEMLYLWQLLHAPAIQGARLRLRFGRHYHDFIQARSGRNVIDTCFDTLPLTSYWHFLVPPIGQQSTGCAGLLLTSAREIFVPGSECFLVKVKAKPARRVVKAFAVKVLKDFA